MSIKITGNLIPSIQNTPLDARSFIEYLDDVPNIQNPVLGGIFYCKEDGKHYKITSLKEKQIGGLVVQNAMVNTYEELCKPGLIDTLPSNVTLQGNHFNTGDELVQLKNGKIPSELYDQPNLDKFIPTKVSQLENDKNFVDKKYVIDSINKEIGIAFKNILA